MSVIISFAFISKAYMLQSANSSRQKANLLFKQPRAVIRVMWYVRETYLTNVSVKQYIVVSFTWCNIL
jgi:hypothetical protein